MSKIFAAAFFLIGIILGVLGQLNPGRYYLPSTGLILFISFCIAGIACLLFRKRIDR